jgi:hypothetical protein
MSTRVRIRALLITVLTFLLAFVSLSETPANARTTTALLYEHTVHSGTFWGPNEGFVKDVKRSYTTPRVFVRGPIDFHIVNRAGTTNLGIYRTTCTVRVTLRDRYDQIVWTKTIVVNTPKAASWPTADTGRHYSVKKVDNTYRFWPKVPAGFMHFRTTILDHMYAEHIPGTSSGAPWIDPPNLYFISSQQAVNDCVGYARVVFTG